MRSGQSVIFTEGDDDPGLVSSGAEIVAEGLSTSTTLAAALSGWRQRQFQRADLLPENRSGASGTDGYYQTAEEIDASLRDRPAQARYRRYHEDHTAELIGEGGLRWPRFWS